VRDEIPRGQARGPGQGTRRRGAWRGQNPEGTAEQLVADIGYQFHLDYGVVLRALLFAADRHQARVITGAAGSAGPGRARR